MSNVEMKVVKEFFVKDPFYDLWRKHPNLPTSIFTANEGNSAKVFYQDGSSYVLRNIQDITVQPLKGGDTDVCITYNEADKAISEGITLKRGEVEVVIRASFISKIVIDESDVQSVYYQKHLKA